MTHMVQVQCAECGVEFAIPAALSQAKRLPGSYFFCPNGHPIRYVEHDEAMGNRELAQQVEDLQGKLSTRISEIDRHTTKIYRLESTLKRLRKSGEKQS